MASSRYRCNVEFKKILPDSLQVRGTPTSGKSTLAKLLGRYIKDREPAIDLIWISGWTFTDVEAAGGWERYLKDKRHWVEDKKTVFILMKRRHHTRTAHSGTTSSNAYATTLIAAPLPL